LTLLEATRVDVNAIEVADDAELLEESDQRDDA
jgi:hypothetical protein